MGGASGSPSVLCKDSSSVLADLFARRFLCFLAFFVTASVGKRVVT